MSTVTGVVSLAVPVKEGVVLLERNAGEFSVTTGGLVLTVKLTELLVPGGLPSGLASVATAEYVPFCRGGVTLVELHLPPEGLAVRCATSACKES
jgi:hypothetical protein